MKQIRYLGLGIIVVIVVMTLALVYLVNKRQQTTQTRASEPTPYPTAPPKRKPEFVPGELIVQFKNGEVPPEYLVPARYPQGQSGDSFVPGSLQRFPVKEAEKIIDIDTIDRKPLDERSTGSSVSPTNRPNPTAAATRAPATDPTATSVPSGVPTTGVTATEAPQSSPSAAPTVEVTTAASPSAVPTSADVQGEATDIPSNLANTYVLEFDANAPIQQIAKDMRGDDRVAFAEPNYKYQLDYNPNDPYWRDAYPGNVGGRASGWNPAYDYLWNLKKINIAGAWDLEGNQYSYSYVAVVDSGIDPVNPELTSKVLQEWDYFNNDAQPYDDNGHGTHVAGVIASIVNNNTGISGMSRYTVVGSYKAFDKNGNATLSSLVNSIYDATYIGYQIINMSFSGPTSTSIGQALDYAHANGVVLVASTGNDNDDARYYFPSNYKCNNNTVDCVISVTSSEQNDRKPQYANWGGTVDVAAPGGDDTYNLLSLASSQRDPTLNSFVINTSYLRMSGTSMAAPHVSGLAAMILQKNPNLTPLQVRNIIINGTDDILTLGYDSDSGYGRINAQKSLQDMNTGTPAAVTCFGDVTGTSPYNVFICSLKRENIISGYGDGTFKPAASVSRGEMSKFIINAFKIPLNPNCGASFPDVPTNHTFYSFIMTLRCRGIISGYGDGTFRPANTVTRGETAKFVVFSLRNAKGDPNYLRYTGSTQLFPDLPTTHTFYETLMTSFNQAMIDGADYPYMRPDANASREVMSRLVDVGRRR